MATINWLAGVSGDWTDPADWSGGVVPGADDSAEIDVKSTFPYTVSVTTQVEVAALELASTKATLALSGSLDVTEFDLKQGKLLLDGGTLAGSVDDASGRALTVSGTGTLQDVTWTGPLIADIDRARHGQPASTLTIAGGLTLLPVNGTGVGSAILYGPTTLSGLTALNGAVIKAFDLAVVNSPTLTLGSSLTLTDLGAPVAITLSAGETLVNDGLVLHPVVAAPDGSSGAGTIVNDAQIDKGADFGAATVTNNGTITAEAGDVVVVDLQTWQKPGASGEIVLDSGVVAWASDDTLTTAQLLKLDPTQNVTAQGSFGFAVGMLDNTGATLTIGQGTVLGTLSGALPATISGGTVVLQDADPVIANATFRQTTLVGSGSLTVMNVALDGVALSGITSITATQGLYLDGVTLAAPGDVLAVDATSGEIRIGRGQTLDGVSFALATSTIQLDPGASTQGATLSVAQYGELAFLGAAKATVSGTLSAATTLDLNGLASIVFAGGNARAPLVSNLSFSGDVQLTIGGGYLVSVGPHETRSGISPGYLSNTGTLDLSGTSAGLAISDQAGALGYFTNSGTVAITDGSLSLTPSRVVNTGSVSVTDGSLNLSGPLTVASLNAFGHAGSQVEVSGQLDLGGQTVTLGQGGIPDFSLGDIADGAPPSLQDGTFVVSAGALLAITGSSTFDVRLVNDGTIGLSAEPGAPSSITGTLDGSVSGTGTIQIGNQEDSLVANAAIGSSQTIAFGDSGETMNSADTLVFGSLAAATGFQGTLATFSITDRITFVGETVTSASFSGASIAVVLDGDTTLKLATKSALTGSLSVVGGTVEYASRHDAPDGLLAPSGHAPGWLGSGDGAAGGAALFGANDAAARFYAPSTWHS